MGNRWDDHSRENQQYSNGSDDKNFRIFNTDGVMVRVVYKQTKPDDNGKRA